MKLNHRAVNFEARSFKATIFKLDLFTANWITMFPFEKRTGVDCLTPVELCWITYLRRYRASARPARHPRVG